MNASTLVSLLLEEVDPEMLEAAQGVALYSNNPGYIRTALATGADVNTGYTTAARHRYPPVFLVSNVEALDVFIKAGADINMKLDVSGLTTTPLKSALDNNRLSVALKLLEAGAKPTKGCLIGLTQIPAYTKEKIPWSVAVAKALIQAGADVNETETFSLRTPLIRACSQGSPELVAVLLDAGADFMHKARDGEMAYVAAQDRARHGMFEDSPFVIMTVNILNVLSAHGDKNAEVVSRRLSDSYLSKEVTLRLKRT